MKPKPGPIVPPWNASRTWASMLCMTCSALALWAAPAQADPPPVEPSYGWPYSVDWFPDTVCDGHVVRDYVVLDHCWTPTRSTEKWDTLERWQCKSSRSRSSSRRRSHSSRGPCYSSVALPTPSQTS